MLCVFFKGQALAAFLKTDKTSYTVVKDGTFNVDVIVDAGTDVIRSTDVILVYDPTILTAQSVTAGTFFPTVANNIASGKVTITAYVDNAASSKSGSGTVATVSFKGIKDGSGTLTFDCGSATGSKVTKNDTNFTNVIVCTQNTSSSVTVGAGGAATTATPTPASSTPGATTPAALPQSGFFDNTANIAFPGMVLLLIGLGLKLLL